MKRHFLLPTILLFTSLAFADDVVWDSPVEDVEKETELLRITNQISSLPVVRSNFIQTRFLSILKKPLITHGRFIYSREHGLYWNLLKPYESTYIVTANNLYSYDIEHGRRPLNQGGKKVFRQISMMFAAVFTADVNVLQKKYKIYYSGSEKNWVIGLRPKGGVVKKLIKEIVVKGDMRVKNVILLESSGDKIVIDFGAIPGESVELTSEELKYFVD